MKNSDWNNVIEVVQSEVNDDQIQDMIRTVYHNLSKSAKFTQDEAKKEQAIVTVAEYLYRSAQVADQFINFAAMIIELKRI